MNQGILRIKEVLLKVKMVASVNGKKLNRQRTKVVSEIFRRKSCAQCKWVSECVCCQSVEEIDESQCKTHGPVTVSCGTSEKISNIVAVTVSLSTCITVNIIIHVILLSHQKTGLLIGKGHSENSTFAYQKPNSGK